ncbi:sodium:proton antiporter [Bacillus carboniphilus]|uniref:Sodium:proton antiporter n=1 Tax=Bacillus carboniphilus TaxID=86663 RepID=A0ABY9JSR6_9BACI|nr:sodium:proton antiporter [Bacillus carboniphilus]WLR42441.1 sodium:proton antiporter [Bacillus carboniphilus]
MIDSLLFSIVLITVLGVLSQWVAWRYKLPAIVVMSISGLLVGPIFGFIQPMEDFGTLYSPLISIAVAIILFEGSLNLDLKEIKDLNKPVFRIVTFGAILAWLLGSFTAHAVAGLSWEVAFIIGGLFIVTGPTVILPMLRQAKLNLRPAKILKWEGIIVDPLGALLAVFTFEFIKFFTNDKGFSILGEFLFISLCAIGIGIFFGYGIGWLFKKGHVPEFLKSPFVFAVVLLSFALAEGLMHETGLLSVTAMGMVIANMKLNSIEDMRHFKENISVLLISTIFIMITASLTRETLFQVFQLEIILFVLLMLFVVRPLSIYLSTAGTDLTRNEKLLIGWIAPRGIVALTVSGYLSSLLISEGFEEASILNSLTFALVFTTVCVHGFSIRWAARKLDLAYKSQAGVLLVGGNPFTTALGQVLEDLSVPVLIIDSSWKRLSLARKVGIPSYRGEILAAETEYQVDMTPYDYLLSATEFDSYNALVCTTHVPHIGRNNLFQLSLERQETDGLDELGHTVGGRNVFSEKATWGRLNAKVKSGYVMRKTSITEQYSFETYLRDQDDDTVYLFLLKETGDIEFFTTDHKLVGEPGDIVVALMPPSKEFRRIRERLNEER